MDGAKTPSSDLITEGKNIGRSNETTPTQQAELEAKSRHTKKLKNGYTASLEDAKAGKTDKVITGGYVPMTARTYFDYDIDLHQNVPSKEAKHIEFPCGVQPKLDGLRCTKDKEKLYTRSRKEFKMIPHITEAVADEKVPLDGELYNHMYKDNFEKIVSSIKREKELHKDYELIQYHIYDCNIPGLTFEERWRVISKLKKKYKDHPHIKFVKTRIANTPEELVAHYNKFLEEGYEGAMVRNLKAPYESKRSKHIQKLKMFEDAEFKVIGVNEGRGKLKGCAATFLCEIDDEHGYRTFDANLEGSQELLREYFENADNYIGKMLTVKFQGYTKKNTLPRINTGMKFKDELEK